MGFRIVFNDPNLAEEGHNIYRSSSPMDINNMPAPIASVGADVELYDDGDVTPGLTYYYRVGAFTAGGTVEKISDEIEVVAEENDIIVAGAEWWYSLDSVNETTGEVPDDSGNGYLGQLSDSNITLEPGLFGNCFAVQSSAGDNSQVNMPILPLTENPEISLSVWVYWDGVASGTNIKGIWGHGNDANRNCHFEIRGTGTNDLRLRLGDFNKDNFPTPQANDWVMLTFTYDGTTVKMYHNATEVDQATGNSGTLFGTFTLSTGGPGYQNFANSGARPFKNSKVGAARFYFRALTSQEVAELYDERLVT